MPSRPLKKEASVVSVMNGLLRSWPFFMTRILPPFWTTKIRPSGAMAMEVVLLTWATSLSVKPVGTLVALSAGSACHQSSATKQAAKAATAMISMTDQLAWRLEWMLLSIVAPFFLLGRGQER